MNPQDKAPPKTLIVKVDGVDREVTMSYGLLDKLLREIRDTNEIGKVYTDPDTRVTLIEEVLADRTKTGKLLVKRAFDEYEIELEEIDKIAGWVVDHTTAFFIRAISQLESRLTPEVAVAQETQSEQQPIGSQS